MSAPSAPCPTCGKPLTWVPQYNAWYCYAEKRYHQPAPAPARTQSGSPATAQGSPQPGLWYQNFYRIRAKVLALAQQYYIEDGSGRQLAYSRQKMFRLKEDIRIFANETMAQELFRIQQVNWTDAWGDFAVVDSATNVKVGSIRRKALKSIIKGEWDLFDPQGRLFGQIKQETGRALMRRFMPMGGLVPDKLSVELNGQTVATIDQQFKVIGDIWEINAQWTPPALDRRVLLGCALLMGMIERQQGG